MKVVCLVGSPRVGGNTDIIGDKFLEAAKKLGAEVKKYYLNQLKFRGCQACMGCKKVKETCVIPDDLTQVLEDVRKCDVLLLSSPVYYSEITAQLKAFIDRTYCYLTPDFISSSNPSRLAKGKKMAFILAQNHPDANMFKDIFPRYQSIFGWYGFDDIQLLRVVGVAEKGDVNKHPEVFQQTEELAKKWINK